MGNVTSVGGVVSADIHPLRCLPGSAYQQIPETQKFSYISVVVFCLNNFSASLLFHTSLEYRYLERLW